MSAIEIIIGSQMGSAEYTAEQIEEKLTEQGHSVTLHEQPDYHDINQTDVIWLICTSTHGAGDLPDNIQAFFTELTSQSPNLSALKYGVVSLGDSSYDTFCMAGTTIDDKLNALGASRIGEKVEIDILEHPLPEEHALEWLTGWIPLLD